MIRTRIAPLAAAARIGETIAAAAKAFTSASDLKKLRVPSVAVPDAVLDSLSGVTGVANLPVNFTRHFTHPPPDRLVHERPVEKMPLGRLLALRDMQLGCTAAYVLARLGATRLEVFLEEFLPEYVADFKLSDDDHVVLVSHARRQVYFSCRGTDGHSAERVRRDVLAYYAILRCRRIDPKDHPRIVNTLREARETHRRYVRDRGYTLRFIGHSFGGFVASICAQELDCEAVNFNGPVYRPRSGNRLAAMIVEEAVEAAVAQAVGEVNTDAESVLVGSAGSAPSDVAAAASSSNEPATGKFDVVTTATVAVAKTILAAATSAATVTTRKPTNDPRHEPVKSKAAKTKHDRHLIQRRGCVHHVQLGNDVVSLVGGALPHDCESFTRLRFEGSPYNFKGHHWRHNVLSALDAAIARAAVAAGIQPKELLATRYAVAERLRKERRKFPAEFSKPSPPSATTNDAPLLLLP
jgi:pimeloyl-ACP methyl ester carboxylesterase